MKTSTIGDDVILSVLNSVMDEQMKRMKAHRLIRERIQQVLNKYSKFNRGAKWDILAGTVWGSSHHTKKERAICAEAVLGVQTPDLRCSWSRGSRARARRTQKATISMNSLLSEFDDLIPTALFLHIISPFYCNINRFSFCLNAQPLQSRTLSPLFLIFPISLAPIISAFSPESPILFIGPQSWMPARWEPAFRTSYLSRSPHQAGGYLMIKAKGVN